MQQAPGGFPALEPGPFQFPESGFLIGSQRDLPAGNRSIEIGRQPLHGGRRYIDQALSLELPGRGQGSPACLSASCSRSGRSGKARQPREYRRSCAGGNWIDSPASARRARIPSSALAPTRARGTSRILDRRSPDRRSESAAFRAWRTSGFCSSWDRLRLPSRSMTRRSLSSDEVGPGGSSPPERNCRARSLSRKRPSAEDSRSRREKGPQDFAGRRVVLRCGPRPSTSAAGISGSWSSSSRISRNLKGPVGSSSEQDADDPCHDPAPEGHQDPRSDADSIPHAARHAVGEGRCRTPTGTATSTNSGMRWRSLYAVDRAACAGGITAASGARRPWRRGATRPPPAARWPAPRSWAPCRA